MKYPLLKELRDLKQSLDENEITPQQYAVRRQELLDIYKPPEELGSKASLENETLSEHLDSAQSLPESPAVEPVSEKPLDTWDTVSEFLDMGDTVAEYLLDENTVSHLLVPKAPSEPVNAEHSSRLSWVFMGLLGAGAAVGLYFLVSG